MALFELIGLVCNSHPVSPVPELQMVVYNDQTAVLSAAPKPFLRLPKGRRDHLIEVAERLRRQEDCMALGTFLPVQQGSALTKDGAKALLVANQPELAGLFARFAGLVQLQITVSWDEKDVLARFCHSRELAPIFQRGHVDPKELGLAIAALATRLSGAIAAELSAVASDIVELPVTTGILWNGAVLVPHAQLAALDQAVEAIDAIWSEGLKIRQIGPAPISSFVTLKLEPVTRKQIDRALERFRLQTGWASADLAQARRLALKSLGPESDSAAREAIREQARIAEAAARLEAAGLADGADLVLCHLSSIGRTIAETLPDRAVA
jgi:hypothetical protein